MLEIENITRNVVTKIKPIISKKIGKQLNKETELVIE